MPLKKPLYGKQIMKQPHLHQFVFILPWTPSLTQRSKGEITKPFIICPSRYCSHLLLRFNVHNSSFVNNLLASKRGIQQTSKTLVYFL